MWTKAFRNLKAYSIDSFIHSFSAVYQCPSQLFLGLMFLNVRISIINYILSLCNMRILFKKQNKTKKNCHNLRAQGIVITFDCPAILIPNKKP